LQIVGTPVQHGVERSSWIGKLPHNIAILNEAAAMDSDYCTSFGYFCDQATAKAPQSQQQQTSTRTYGVMVHQSRQLLAVIGDFSISIDGRYGAGRRKAVLDQQTDKDLCRIQGVTQSLRVHISAPIKAGAGLYDILVVVLNVFQSRWKDMALSQRFKIVTDRAGSHPKHAPSHLPTSLTLTCWTGQRRGSGA
jgi:hypothetical protein